MSYGISKINAKNFVKKWKGKGNENQDCQFWTTAVCKKPETHTVEVVRGLAVLLE